MANKKKENNSNYFKVETKEIENKNMCDNNVIEIDDDSDKEEYDK
jgi:hypothetical protein